MIEESILFGTRRSLVGIVTAPAGTEWAKLSPAVILLNAGLVHRAGPGRIYVKIARSLAAAGFLALRFDFSGIGDSLVRTDTLCFEKSAIAETQEAMAYLQATRGIQSFILMGGCSGALASLETALCDSRVSGTVLINFQMPGADDGNQSEAAKAERATRNAAFYYLHRALWDFRSWCNLFSGRTNYVQLLRALWSKARRGLSRDWHGAGEATQFAESLKHLAERKVRTVFVCSEGDPRLNDIRDAGGVLLRRLFKTGDVLLDVISGADHTFSSFQDQERLRNVVLHHVSNTAANHLGARESSDHERQLAHAAVDLCR